MSEMLHLKVLAHNRAGLVDGLKWVEQFVAEHIMCEASSVGPNKDKILVNWNIQQFPPPPPPVEPVMTEDERVFIDALLKHYSYKTGEFTLASGLKSSEYIDVKTALLHPCAGRALMVATCREALGAIHEIDCFAGVAVGAVPLASGVSQVAWEFGQLLPALIVRMEAKAHGTARSVDGEDALVRGAAYSGVGFKDANHRTNACVLLEDVITTGGSTIKALQKLEESKRVFPVGVIAVLDRELGGIDAIKAAYPHLIVRTLTRIGRVRQAPALELMPEWSKMGAWMRLRPPDPKWPLTR